MPVNRPAARRRGGAPATSPRGSAPLLEPRRPAARRGTHCAARRRPRRRCWAATVREPAERLRRGAGDLITRFRGTRCGRSRAPRGQADVEWMSAMSDLTASTRCRRRPAPLRPRSSRPMPLASDRWPPPDPVAPAAPASSREAAKPAGQGPPSLPVSPGAICIVVPAGQVVTGTARYLVKNFFCRGGGAVEFGINSSPSAGDSRWSSL